LITQQNHLIVWNKSFVVWNKSFYSINMKYDTLSIWIMIFYQYELWFHNTELCDEEQCDEGLIALLIIESSAMKSVYCVINQYESCYSINQYESWCWCYNKELCDEEQCHEVLIAFLITKSCAMKSVYYVINQSMNHAIPSINMNHDIIIRSSAMKSVYIV